MNVSQREREAAMTFDSTRVAPSAAESTEVEASGRTFHQKSQAESQGDKAELPIPAPINVFRPINNISFSSSLLFFL